MTFECYNCPSWANADGIHLVGVRPERRSEAEQTACCTRRKELFEPRSVCQGAACLSHERVWRAGVSSFKHVDLGRASFRSLLVFAQNSGFSRKSAFELEACEQFVKNKVRSCFGSCFRTSQKSRKDWGDTFSCSAFVQRLSPAYCFPYHPWNETFSTLPENNLFGLLNWNWRRWILNEICS